MRMSLKGRLVFLTLIIAAIVTAASFSMTHASFSLAQSFNGFYHKYSILNEEREDARLWRAAAVAYA